MRKFEDVIAFVLLLAFVSATVGASLWLHQKTKEAAVSAAEAMGLNVLDIEWRWGPRVFCSGENQTKWTVHHYLAEAEKTETVDICCHGDLRMYCGVMD